MYEETVTVHVLNKDTEAFIDTLHPNLVEIEESNELYGLKGIIVQHPLKDDTVQNLGYYDSLLVAGNKIYRPKTCDGEEALYVLLGDKEYDYKNNRVSMYAEEVATELGQCGIERSSSFSWTVNEAFIERYFGNYFSPGVLSGPSGPTVYSGAKTPLGILRKIEELTGGEFNFRYELSENNLIRRYIDYYTKIGTEHEVPLELGYNVTEIKIKISETNVRVAAGPIGEPQSSSDNFHQARAAFENMAFSTSTAIPLWVTQDENGSPVNGPMAYPPYNKPAGQGWVECSNSDKLKSNYQRAQYQAIKQPGSKPRIYPFETNETNVYNLYWACIEKINQYTEAEVSIDCNVANLNQLQGLETESFNVGDTVYLKIPNKEDTIEARILSTTKDPRNPATDKIEIGNYKIDFMSDLTKGYYNSAGTVVIN